MLCFNKSTGEHDTKKILKKSLVLWAYISKEILMSNIPIEHTVIELCKKGGGALCN